MEETTYTAFRGSRRLATGDLRSVIAAVKTEVPSDELILFFEDTTGGQVDFDLRGTVDEVLARVIPAATRPGPGRPRLGVVSGEVSLLPRHWEWLERQQHNISATIRRLVEEAIRNEPDAARARHAIEAADRELWVLAGNLPGCEEASRALYAGDSARFTSLAVQWPPDIAQHLCAMAERGRV
jgi:uncharacterized protein